MKKKKPQIEKIRDKYWEEDRPGANYDFFELLTAPEDLEEVINAHSERFGLIQELDPSDYLPDRKRQEEMLQQICEAAAKVLTPSQYKVFIMRYKFGLKEEDIAKQMGTSQPYVSRTIPVLHYKIRKALQIEPPRRRKTVKNTPKTRSKKNFKRPSKKSLKS